MTKEFLEQIRLREGGGGGDPAAGLCVMELVSWLEGVDDVCDRPESACPALTSFAIALNDSAPSARTRDTLKPLAPLLCGSADGKNDNARAAFIRLAVARDIVPALLRNSGLGVFAHDLRMAQTDADIEAAARAIRGHVGRDLGSILLARLVDTMCERQPTGLAEQVLLHLEELAGGARLRLTLWRKMKSILEQALPLGRFGSPDDPRIAARLGALRQRIDPRAEPVAPIAAAPALPAWLNALVHGPADEPILAPAPKARELIDA